MTSLFIINNPHKLIEALPFIGKDDGILLIEDAVALATSNNGNSHCNNQYALEEDLIARGLKDKTHNGWELIDYPQFVELTLTFDKSITWV